MCFKKNINILIAIILLVSCSCGRKNSSKTKKSFSLQEIILNLSTNMSNGDTIHLFSDLSICSSFHFEHDIITKSHDSLFIEGIAKGVILEEWSKVLPKANYKLDETDSLSFEGLFRFVSERDTKANNIYAKTFKIVLKNDTVIFYSNGLGEQVPTVEYFLSIKRKIYPELELYKTHNVQVPPPPPAPKKISDILDKVVDDVAIEDEIIFEMIEE